MKLSLYYEVYPHVLSQKYGNIPLGSDGKSIYAQFGFTEHNGVDILPALDKEVRAPIPCETVWMKWMPNGGGNVLGLISLNEYDGPKGKPAYVLIDYLHLESFKTQVGKQHNIGDLVAISDNTGFSTGPHIHAQYRWVYKKNGRLIDVEKNNAHNSFNPEPFRNGVYAKKIALEKQVTLLSTLVALLKQLKLLKK